MPDTNNKTVHEEEIDFDETPKVDEVDKPATSSTSDMTESEQNESYSACAESTYKGR